jgi:DNA recombination protein RmuC
VDINPILLSLGSIALGATLPALYFQFRTKPQLQREISEQKASLAAAVERDKSLRQQLDTVMASKAETESELKRVEASLIDLSTKLATSEVRADRAGALQEEVLSKQHELAALSEKYTITNAKCAELAALIDAERRATAEKLATINDAQKQLSDAFNAVSAEALMRNNQTFLDLAKTHFEQYQQNASHQLEVKCKSIEETVKPIHDSLTAVNAQIHEIELARASAFSSITEQFKVLATGQTNLQQETQRLVKALRAPSIGGRWGEIQLRNVVEMAGMLEYCDFVEQPNTTTEDNERLRPT